MVTAIPPMIGTPTKFTSSRWSIVCKIKTVTCKHKRIGFYNRLPDVDSYKPEVLNNSTSVMGYDLHSKEFRP